MILLIVLIAGLGFLVYKYTPIGNTVMGLFGSSTGGAATEAGAPTISNVKDLVSGTSAIIEWATDKNSSSQVEYGKTEDYGLLAPETPDTDPTGGKSLGVISHKVTITGLEPGSTYHYRAKSVGKDGEEGVSPDKTFTVAQAEE